MGSSCIYLVFIHFYLAPGKGMRARVLGKLIPSLIALTLARKSRVVMIGISDLCVSVYENVCVCVYV